MKNAIIMGAAGRDFHNFNVFFRNNIEFKVVCFTATQIPGISNRKYPKELAGKRYPKGIPIYPENKLSSLIKKHKIDTVFFSYSDISHDYVMKKATEIMAAGAAFTLLGPEQTQLQSKKKVIAVTAVRTGCGKSQTTRKIAEYLKKRNKRFAIIRHPMPYGNLKKQAVQRFASEADLKKHKCTLEEREEYEPYVAEGIPIFAGVDYGKILKQAEKEADIILWDGGNNDFSFIKPNLHIVVTDPLRAGHELTYYPGAINFQTADIIIINKINSATKKQINIIKENKKKVNPKAKLILTDSIVSVDNPKLIKNKRVLIVEDGPTVTHGEMAIGAGMVAAKKYKAKKIVNPTKSAVGSIKKAYARFPHLKKIIPALGYSKRQLKELEKTINKANCDTVIIGTPIDLSKIIHIKKPCARVYYNLKIKQGSLLTAVNKLL